jgi:hypothetical protein
MDTLQQVFAVNTGYSLVAATMVGQDSRMLSQLYAPNAVLHVPDSTITGVAAIVRRLLVLAQAKSLTDFQRTSQGRMAIDDSTLVDSGAYTMTLKRTSGNSISEYGRYSTTWRTHQDAAKWVILEDRIQPGAPAKKGAK